MSLEKYNKKLENLRNWIFTGFALYGLQLFSVPWNRFFEGGFFDYSLQFCFLVWFFSNLKKGQEKLKATINNELPKFVTYLLDKKNEVKEKLPLVHNVVEKLIKTLIDNFGDSSTEKKIDDEKK
jgi:hypothetical protein